MKVYAESLKKNKAKLRGTHSLPSYYAEQNIVLPISVGNLSHEKNKLGAIVEMINQRFTTCDIVLADTLQRHNFLDKVTEKEATTIARNAGDEWLERNQVYLQKLSLPTKIIRWDECLAHRDYALWHNKINTSYENNSDYRSFFENDVKRIIERKKINENSTNRNEIEKNCLNYFFEEIAVVSSFFIENNYHYLLYPGRRPTSFDATKKIFLQEKHPDLLGELIIYFD